MANTLFWFTDDLRVHDNPALLKAAQTSKTLTCVFCVEPRWDKANAFGTTAMSKKRHEFMLATLHRLSQQLRGFGQRLQLITGPASQAITTLLLNNEFDRVVRSRQSGHYEQQAWQKIQQAVEPHRPNLSFEEEDSHTLFNLAQLPDFSPFPQSFSKFRKQVSHLLPAAPEQKPLYLPAPTEIEIGALANTLLQEYTPATQTQGQIEGGEAAGLAHLADYFASDAPSSYKQTRNALQGWSQSTKLSIWLANGSLSVRKTYDALKHYEQLHGANDSTEWIYFELLWREYFFWLARHQQASLFLFGGQQNKKLLTSFYPQRFKQWCAGETPWPLVNACMKELNATGFMSNRGRQIVASCLINELQLDWRCGAAYFEQQLLDYEVGSNWGNWQYIAGVGADPRGGRHFNIEKQTKEHDPEGEFQRRWLGPSYQQAAQGRASIDTVDAADWPI